MTSQGDDRRGDGQTGGDPVANFVGANENDPSPEAIDAWLDSIEPDPADARDATEFRQKYAEMAADYATNPPRADEIVGPIVVIPENAGRGKRRATSADYEAMADSYEADPPRRDEIRSIEVRPKED